jgi:SEC-C motif-containing protein
VRDADFRRIGDVTTPGRNDRCPCGSGRKYKHCHGATIAIVPIGATSGRRCGTCTACCDGWVVGTIEGHEMKPGVPCHFRGDGCCTIYERRPENPCRTFVCGWLAPNSPLPDAFRPDRLGVMIVPTLWRGRLAYILVAAPHDPDDTLLAWMRTHAERERVPFFYERGGEKFGFGPPEFQQEMLAKASRGERLW